MSVAIGTTNISETLKLSGAFADAYKQPLETTKKLRPKAPRVNWMIQIKPFGVFTIDAERFIKDGGSMDDPTWIGVYALSLDHARIIGESLILQLKGSK